MNRRARACFVCEKGLRARDEGLRACGHLWKVLTIGVWEGQDAGTIPALLPYLSYQDSQTLQLEALRAIYNLCRISRTRQEAAAVAGIIPRLTALAVLQPAPKGSGLLARLPHANVVQMACLPCRLPMWRT